jgi:hypothetical protein
MAHQSHFEHKRGIHQASTAIEHFHSPNFHARIVAPQHALIMDAMHTSAQTDFTIGELAWLAKMDKSAVSARRFEMLRDELIVKGKRRPCKFSDIYCETVKLAEGV